MGRVEKTVFLSYRRVNAPWALAIVQALHRHGYDVFADLANAGGSDFARVQAHMLARAHFLVVLTPSALATPSRPGDALRRDVEMALKLERHVIPLVLGHLSLETPHMADQLTGSLALLRRFTPLTISALGFTDAMDRLRSVLNTPVEAVILPPSALAERAARAQQFAAASAAPVDHTVLVAQEYYERAIAATDPDDQAAYLSLAIDSNPCSCASPAHDRAPRDSRPNGCAGCDNGVPTNPSHAAALNARGLLRAARGDGMGARADYDRAIRANPEYAAAFHNRGLLRAAENDRSGALQDYDTAIRLDPSDAAALNNRGILRDLLGDRPGARADFDAAIRVNPTDSSAFNNRGLHRHAMGDREGAREDFDAAVRLNPRFAAPYNNRALLREALGDHAGARADLDTAVSLNPSDAAAYNNRGSWRAAHGDAAGARTDYDAAIRLNPLDATAFNNRGLLRAKHGDPAGAMEDYDTALRLNTSFAAALYNRAALHEAIGDRAAAQQDFTHALHLNPELKPSKTTGLFNRVLKRRR